MPTSGRFQIQAAIQSSSRVLVHTSFLSDAELAGAHRDPADDVAATVAKRLAAAGPAARLNALTNNLAGSHI